MRIVRGLQRVQPGIELQTAFEAGLEGLPDLEVLAIAAQSNRILLSHDNRTMPIHFATFLQGGQHSPGVFIISQKVSVRDAVELLHLAWQASQPSEWLDRLEHLP